MNKWQKEVQKSLLESEEAAIKELEKQYKASLNEINQKVKLFEADIRMLDEAINTEGIDEAAKARLQSQKRSKVYQKQYQEALQGQISGILDRMHGNNYSTIESYLKGCYEDAFVGELYNLAQQDVPIITPINQAAMTQAILTDSKIKGSLYKSLGVDVSKLKKTISQEISRGIASSLSYSEIARNISNASNAPLSRTKTITRTEGHRVQQKSSADAAEEARSRGADLVKVWDSVLDGKTRPSHRSVDGEIKELDELFSNGLKYPGDPAGTASEVVNCRCIRVHKPRWDAEGGFAKMDNFTGEVLTFESAKDYAEFKERYWSKENVDYMKYADTLEKRYETKDYNKLLEQMTDSEYEHLKKLEDASPMWSSKYLKGVLPKNFEDTRTIGETISPEDLSAFINKANSKGIQIGYKKNPSGGFETYRGDPAVLDELLDRFEEQQNSKLYRNSGAGKITLKYDDIRDARNVIETGTFAQTNGTTITLNKFMFDDSDYLEKEYIKAVKQGLFVKGTTHHNIADHEVGHILDRKVKSLYTRTLHIITSLAKDEGVSVTSFIKNNISIYAATQEMNEHFPELIPEINSMLNSGNNNDIINALKKEGVFSEN